MPCAGSVGAERRGARLRLAIGLLAAAAIAPLAAAGIDDQAAAIAPLAERSLLLGCAAAGSRRIVVGERGHILISSDSGANWRQVPVPTRSTLTAALLRDDGRAWAVGHDLSVLRSDDGGDSWQLLHREPEEDRPLLDIWFADARNGIAVGAYGLLMRTADGGDSWQFDELQLENPNSEDLLPGEEPLPPDYHLNAIAEGRDGALYLAAEAGFLYRSDDRGASWRELPSPYHGSFFGLLVLDDGGLLAFGLRGHLFRSDDRGEHWRQLPTGGDALLMDGLSHAGRHYITGLGGSLLESADGEHFRSRDDFGQRDSTCLMPGADGALIASGEGGLQRLATGASSAGGTTQ